MKRFFSEPPKAELPKSAFTPEQERALRAWTTYYPYPMMGLIAAMREVQQWRLCVRPEDEKYLAGLFQTTIAHVHEVATFFPYFTRKPTGRKRIGLCRTLSCALAGSEAMAACLERKLGVAEGQATADGAFSFERMECLGACEQAPALVVNEELKGAATESLIDSVLAERS